MMKTIWKFPLIITDHQSVPMPTGATLLDVQMQGDSPCLWALVDPKTTSRTPVHIGMRGTGQPISEPVGNYIATFQTGPLVFHVFEVQP